MTRLANISSLPMSRDTRQLNAHLFEQRAAGEAPVPIARPVGAGKVRLRQDTKPLMNGLETRLLAHLQAFYGGVTIRAQAKRYRLANGIWYKPDFTAIIAGVEHAWEAKGPKAFRGGFENLKVAAAQYPEVTWTLIWEANGHWNIQIILP